MNASIQRSDTVDLLARISNDDGSYPALHTISSITLTIRNTTIDQQTHAATLIISDVMTASPVMDATRWAEDNTGFNLDVTVGAKAFAGAGNYQAQVNITRNDSSTITLNWNIQVTN